MTCQEARELLCEYEDGGLPRSRREALTGHLEACADCARERALLQRTMALVESLEEIPVAPGFTERVLAAARPPAPVRIGWPVGLTLGLAGLVLSVAALVGVALLAPAGLTGISDAAALLGDLAAKQLVLAVDVLGATLDALVQGLAGPALLLLAADLGLLAAIAVGRWRLVTARGRAGTGMTLAI